MKRCSCVVFSLKPLRKDLTNKSLSPPPPPHPHPPPSPSVPQNDVKKILAVFCRVARGFHISCIQIQHFSGGKEQLEGGGGGGEREKTLGLFVGKNNTGTSFQITQVGLQSLGGFWHTWNFSRNGTYVIVAQSCSVVCPPILGDLTRPSRWPHCLGQQRYWGLLSILACCVF